LKKNPLNQKLDLNLADDFDHKERIKVAGLANDNLHLVVAFEG